MPPPAAISEPCGGPEDCAAVYIEHRDRGQRVALVREDRLEYLESRARTASPPRPLVGSVRIADGWSVEQVIADVREDDRVGLARRMERLAGEDE